MKDELRNKILESSLVTKEVVNWDDSIGIPSIASHSPIVEIPIDDLIVIIEDHYRNKTRRIKSDREKIDRLLTKDAVSKTSIAVSKMTINEKRDFAEHLRNEGYSLDQSRRAMGLKHKSNVQYLLQSHGSADTERLDDD